MAMRYRLITFADGTTSLVADDDVINVSFSPEGEGTEVLKEQIISKKKHDEIVIKQAQDFQVQQSENTE